MTWAACRCFLDAACGPWYFNTAVTGLWYDLGTNLTKMQMPKGQGETQRAVREAVPKSCFKVGTSYLTENISPGIKVKDLIFIFLHWMPHLVCWVGEEGERDRKIRVGLNTIIYTLFLKLDHCCWNFYTIARLHRNSILYISVNSDA